MQLKMLSQQMSLNNMLLSPMIIQNCTALKSIVTFCFCDSKSSMPKTDKIYKYKFPPLDYPELAKTSSNVKVNLILGVNL